MLVTDKTGANLDKVGMLKDIPVGNSISKEGDLGKRSQ